MKSYLLNLISSMCKWHEWGTFWELKKTIAQESDTLCLAQLVHLLMLDKSVNFFEFWFTVCLMKMLGADGNYGPFVAAFFGFLRWYKTQSLFLSVWKYVPKPVINRNQVLEETFNLFKNQNHFQTLYQHFLLQGRQLTCTLQANLARSLTQRWRTSV